MRRVIEGTHVGVPPCVCDGRSLPGEEGEVDLILGMPYPSRSRLRIARQWEPDPNHRVAGLQDRGAAVLRSKIQILPRLDKIVDERVVVPFRHFVAEGVNVAQAKARLT